LAETSACTCVTGRVVPALVHDPIIERDRFFDQGGPQNSEKIVR
jgi:hypothetical protein